MEVTNSIWREPQSVRNAGQQRICDDSSNGYRSNDSIECFLEIEKNHGVGSLGLSSHASSGAKIVHSHGDWEVPSASDLLMLEKSLIYICLMISDGTMYSFPNM